MQVTSALKTECFHDRTLHMNNFIVLLRYFISKVVGKSAVWMGKENVFRLCISANTSAKGTLWNYASMQVAALKSYKEAMTWKSHKVIMTQMIITMKMLECLSLILHRHRWVVSCLFKVIKSRSIDSSIKIPLWVVKLHFHKNASLKRQELWDKSSTIHKIQLFPRPLVLTVYIGWIILCSMYFLRSHSSRDYNINSAIGKN